MLSAVILMIPVQGAGALFAALNVPEYPASLTKMV